jgi:hypothetical protein
MKRPFSVTFLGWLFIAVGSIGVAYHLRDGSFDRWTVLIAAVRVIAIIGGIFLLKGRSWARWLLLVWLAFHVFVGALHSLSNSVAHFVLLAVVAYFLLWSPESKYFRPTLLS